MTREELLEFKPEEWIENFGQEDLMIFISDNRTEEFLKLKLIEECLELAEKLTKSLTKAEGFKPTLVDLQEEAVDVIYNMGLASKYIGMNNEIEDDFLEKRVDMKIVQTIQNILKKKEEPIAA